MNKYERRLRVDGLVEEEFFKRFNEETQRDIIYWLHISKLIHDWEVYDVQTGEFILHSTKENVDRWWRENVEVVNQDVEVDDGNS